MKLDKSAMPKFDSPSLGTASVGTDSTPGTVTSGNIESQNADLPGTMDDNNEIDDTASELSDISSIFHSDAPNMVINELLCYIQNRSCVDPQEQIINACEEFYSPDVITAAKRTLYDTVKTKGRLLVRRGANKTVSDLKDIYHVFMEMEPSDKTSFVAHNLTDLPLAADKDSKMLKEIDTLKSEIKALTLAQIELTTLVKDHLTNRTTQADKKDTNDERTQNVSASVEHEDKERKETNEPKDETKDEQKIGPKDDQNEDVNRGLKSKVDTMTKATTAKDLTQGIKVVENIEDDNDESFEIPCAQPQNHNHSWMRGNQSFITSPCSDHLFSHAVQELTSFPKYTSTGADVSSNRTVPSRTFINSANRFKLNANNQSGNKQDGFTGTGPATSLKAVSHSQHTTHSRGNRACTGLFISRLEPQYTPKHVETYIWQHAGERVRAQKIVSKSSSCSSFYVPCERKVRDSLMDPSIWPEGTFVKLYFS